MKLKLLGNKITAINSKRNPEFEGKLELNTNIKLENIEKYMPKTSSVESLKVSAVFEVDYGELGKIEIEGILFFDADDDLRKEILDNFEKKKFDADPLVSIMNFIIQKFSIKAFELEEELGLPIHIKLPSLQVKKE